MSILGGLLFTIGLGFFLAGAWPVIGFLGFELFIVWGAFKLNYQAAKKRETIETTADTVTVKQTDASGKASATTNEGPAERRQHAGRQHGQHGQLVEWWKWKGERGELEQVQVAWERGMGKGGKQQPVR